MRWPNDQDYNEAVQNPNGAFEDSELKLGSVESYPTGIPKARSGNFASVYKVVSNGTPWAVKCFRYDNPEYRRRYPAIATHLNQNLLPYFVKFRYMSQGIRVGGDWYPILKMRWIDGDSLISFIEKNLNRPAALESLASSWASLLSDLQRTQIAHGDLQHGNVLVVDGKLKLVDYDGMYVPSLGGSRPIERGHPNYQHPERTDLDFGPYLDNFSAWLIYVSLIALSSRPALWQQLKSGDECLLFRKQDLTAPDQSEAFRLLKMLPDVDTHDLVERFEDFLWLPPSRIPPLTLDRLSHPSTTSHSAPLSSPDWIADHLQRDALTSPGPSLETANESEIGDPSWIQDHIEAPVPGSSFVNPVATDRLVAVVLYSLSIALAAWLSLGSGRFATMGIWVGAALSGSVAALLGWFYRYRREPIFASVRTIDSELRQANRAVDTARDKHANLKTERKQRRTTYSTELSKLQSRRDAQQVEEAKEISRIDKALKDILRALHERRRSLAADESNEKRQLADRITVLSHQLNAVGSLEQNEMSQLDQSIGSKVRGLDVQLQQMITKKELELRHALRYYQDEIVNSHLHRQRIADATIAGIGDELKRRLAEAGYVSAGDIGTRNVSVQGIGAKKWDALNSWRLALDAIIRAREAPQALPSHKAITIEQRYENPIKQLQQNLSSGKSQFESLSAGIKQKYSEQKRLLETRLKSEEIEVMLKTSVVERNFESQRDAVLLEEQQAGAQSEKAAAECKRRFQALAAQLSAETEQMQKTYASEIERFNHDLDGAARCVREASWRRDLVSRRRVAYGPFTFRRYCDRVLGTRSK